MNDLLQQISNSVFKVNTSSGTGSGFYIKDSNIIITCFHLVEQQREVAVETRTKKRYPAKVVLVDPGTNLAFLQPSYMFKPPAGLDSFGEAEKDERVLVLGYLPAKGCTAAQGIIASTRQLVKGKHFIRLNTAINPGCSGGPVVNSRGETVGVASHSSLVTPIYQLKEEIESLKLNKDLKFSVKCNFCKLLIFEKTVYCKNCGHSIPRKVFNRFNPGKKGVFVENALMVTGLNPLLARQGRNYWEFYQGSSLIAIYFHKEDYIYAISPINELPANPPDKLFKYILSKPLSNFRLGLVENIIYFSYRFHLWDIYSPKAGEVKKDLAVFPLKAEEMSGILKEYFGCGLSHYSRDTAIEEVEEEAPAPGLVASGYTRQAESFEDIGKWEQALELHKKAEKIYEELGDWAAKARSLVSQAQIFSENSQWPEALELHKKARNLFEKIESRVKIAESITKQGQTYAKQKKWEEAMALFKEARDYYEGIRHKYGLAQTYQNQARVLAEMKQFRQGMNLLEKAEKLLQELDDYWAFIQNNNMMADLLIKEGNMKQASTLPNRVQRFLFQTGRKQESAMFFGARARFFRYYEQLDIALQFRKRELRNFVELGHQEGQAYSFVRQAEILTEMKEFQNSFIVCQKALKIYEEIGHQEGLADTYSEMALISMIMEKNQEALTYQKKAEKIYQELGDREGLAFKYHRFSSVLSERQKWHKAIEFNKKAEKMFLALGDREILAEIYEVQAIIILNKWQNPGEFEKAMQMLEIPEPIKQVENKREKNPAVLNRAMNMLQNTEKLYEQVDDKKRLAYIWWNKGRIYFEQKQQAKGLEMWEKAIKRFKQLEISSGDYEKKLIEKKHSLPTK